MTSIGLSTPIEHFISFSVQVQTRVRPCSLVLGQCSLRYLYLPNHPPTSHLLEVQDEHRKLVDNAGNAHIFRQACELN
jgi:hypothetical protein